MHLHDVEDLAHDLMDDHNLPSQGWTFAFDNAKRRCGRCDYARKLITVSRHHAELNTEETVRDTILHEIAHALAFDLFGPGVGHGAQWQHIARNIGATPARCADASTVVPRAKYELICVNGHSHGPRHRRSRSMSTYVCGRCRAALVYLEN